MGRARRKKGQSILIFFLPVWSKIDNLDKIGRQLALKSAAAPAEAVHSVQSPKKS